VERPCAIELPDGRGEAFWKCRDLNLETRGIEGGLRLRSRTDGYDEREDEEAPPTDALYSKDTRAHGTLGL
jgi:hypothetical protein